MKNHLPKLLLAAASMTACSERDDNTKPIPPTSAAGSETGGGLPSSNLLTPSNTSHWVQEGRQAEFLLDHLDRGQVVSFAMAAIESDRQRLTFAGSSLAGDGTDSGGRRYFQVPVRIDANNGSPEFSRNDQTPLDVVAEHLPWQQTILFVELEQFQKGWAKPRTPEGEQGVLIKKPVDVVIELGPLPTETRLSLEARFVSGTQVLPPKMEFVLDGKPLPWNPTERPILFLPKNLEPQTLTIQVSEISTDPEYAKLVLDRLEITHVDQLDRVVVADVLDLDAVSLSVMPASPDGVTTFVAQGKTAGNEVSRVVHLVPGEAAFVCAGPQAFDILLNERVVATTNGKREAAFSVTTPQAVAITIRSQQALQGEITLHQPSATFANAIAAVRGTESHIRGHSLVHHVQIADETRRSLLFPASSTLTFPVANSQSATPPELKFSWGATLPEGARVQQETPNLKVLWKAEDGTTTTLTEQRNLAVNKWVETTVTLPDGSGELVFHCTADGAMPVATRQVLTALAEPKVVRQPTLRPPNLVIYLIDTLRADHLHCYGYERKTSPNIDALAADGILFENAYAQAPWTRPSIATIFTGLLYSFHGAGKTNGLAPELTTLAEALHEVGYDSAAFIANAQIHGLGLNFVQGFQHFTAVEKILGDSHASQVNEVVFPWLDAQQNEPFFLYVHTIDPHASYDPPPATAGTFNKGYAGTIRADKTGSRYLESRMPLDDADLQYILDLYDEEILFNDQEFGRLVQKLKDMDLYDRTVILVISDHGEEFGEHGSFGHGGQLWQELLQVPFILKPAGGGAPRGLRIDHPVRLLDVYPTMTQSLGFDLLPGICQGTDLTRLWSETDTLEELTVIAEEQPAVRALLTNGMKIIQDNYDNESKETRQLFDLRQDPGEQSDLSADRPQVTEELVSHLLGKLHEYRDAGFEPVNEVLGFEMTPEVLEALRKLGYIDE